MKINIIYEVNNREFNNCVLLQRALILRGHDVRIYNKTESLLFFRRADLTIIPNSYRQEDLDNYRYIFNVNNRIIINYPIEQVTNHILPDFYDNSDKNPIKKIPNFCWGKDYFEFIKSMDYDMSCCRVTGAVQLDLCREEFKDLYMNKAELANKYNLPKGKKWLLFVSDFVYVSKLFLKQVIESEDLSKEELMLRHKTETKTSIAILDWFDRFLSENNDYIIIYRKHPVEMLTENVNILKKKYPKAFYLISDLNIKTWLFNSDKIACWNSTVVIESFVVNKPMALLRPSICEDEGFVKYSFYDDYEKITTYEEFKNAMVNEIPAYTERFKDIINELYSINDKPAFLRVSDAIEELNAEKEKKFIIKENYFLIKRWIYIIRKVLLPKILIKKIYQYWVIHFKYNYNSQGERRYAINEWIASAKNKAVYKEYAKKIDLILKSKF